MLNSKFFTIKFLNKKTNFIDNCEDLLTCEACIRNSDRCGWCYADGLCKSGNAIGASSSSNYCPYSDWEFKKCSLKKCNSYKNQLSCLTQDDCFWCEKVNEKNMLIGSCEEMENKFIKKCFKKYFIEDYFKNPKFYKSKSLNDMLNEELKQLSTLETYDSKKKNIKELTKNSMKIPLSDLDKDIDGKFLKYEQFLKTLKIYMKTNSVKRPPIYNSVLNPAGIFEFQSDILKKNLKFSAEETGNMKNLKSINLDMTQFNSTMFDILSQDSKREIVDISKKIAVQQLSKMFEFNPSEPFFKKSLDFSNLKDYKILEKIASEKWIEFLDKKKIKLNDVRVDIGFYKDDPDSDEDINKIVEKHQKLSILYTFKINNEQVDALEKFSTDKWSKLPGASLTFNAYFNSILVIFQKIRLVGKGSFFESLPVSNEEGVKSGVIIHKKNLSKLNINNFISRKVNIGENKFYVAYKSDFEITRNDDNTIINYAMEFPFVNNFQIYRGSFDPELPKDIISQKIFENIVNVKLPSSSIDQDLLSQNYLFIYKLSSNFLDRNSFIKLTIKNSENGGEFEENFTSHFVHTPFYSEIKNIFGLQAIKLKKGKFRVSMDFKYFLQDFKLEKLGENLIDKEFDIYKKPKLSSNIISFNKNIKKNFVNEKSNNTKRSNITIKNTKRPMIAKTKQNSTLTEKPKLNENIVKPVQNSEAQEHKVVDPNQKKKKKKNKKKKKKHQENNRNFNTSEFSLRDSEEPQDDEIHEDEGNYDGFVKNLKIKNSLDGENLNKNVNLSDEIKISDYFFSELNLESYEKRHILKKIKELSEKMGFLNRQNLNKTIDNNDENRGIIQETNFIENTTVIRFGKKNKYNIIENIENKDNKESDDVENVDLVETTEDNDIKKRNSGDEESKKKKKKKKKNKNKKNDIPHQENFKTNITNITNITQINNTIIFKNSTNNQKNISLLNNNNKSRNGTINKTKVKKKNNEKVKGILEHLTNQSKKKNSKNLPKNFNFFPKSDDISTKNIMKNLNEVLKIVNLEQEQELKNESYELSIIRLPIATNIFHKIYKNTLYFQGNGELNEIPTLQKNLRLKKEKNVFIYLNIIMTLDYIADFEFRLHINGKDECNSAISSKSRHIINENSINIQKLPPGDYKFEILYSTNKQGAVNLNASEWDIFSMTIITFDI